MSTDALDFLDSCYESGYSATPGLLVCTLNPDHDGEHWDAGKNWHF